MKSKNIILKRLLVVMFNPLLFLRVSDNPNLPDIEQLYKDLIRSMYRIRTNYGRGINRMSDLYKLLKCEKIFAAEKGRGCYQIQFKGRIELLNTLYYYGRHGYRTYYLTNKHGLNSYRGKIKKGTVVPISGKAEYRLTRDGWKYEGHSVILESALAPRF
jgi:hypothetical protein